MVLSVSALLMMLCCDNTASVQYRMGWYTKGKNTGYGSKMLLQAALKLILLC